MGFKLSIGGKMKRFAIVAVCISLVAALAFGQAFLANKKTYVALVNETRLALGLNSTKTAIEQADVEILYNIGLLTQRQAASLYEALKAGPINKVNDLLQVKYLGDSTAAVLCLFYKLDTADWKAVK